MDKVQTTHQTITQNNEKKAIAYQNRTLKEYKNLLKIIDEKLGLYFKNYDMNFKTANVQMSFDDVLTFDLSYDDFNVTRLEGLKRQIIQAISNPMDEMYENNNQFLNDLYKEQFYQSSYGLQKDIGVFWEVPPLDIEMVDLIVNKKFAGSNFKRRSAGVNRRLFSGLRNALNESLVLGESQKKVSKRLAERVGISYNDSIRLLQTESNRIITEADHNFYEEDEILEYQIDSTLDGRTSKICQREDQKVYLTKNMKVGKNAPPFHPRCRTITVPYIKGDSIRRMGRNKEGKSVLMPSWVKTYEDWKKYMEL